MKMCKEHWNQLRAAIDERGLTHLVSTSGKGLSEKIAGELTGEPEKETFDPLMGANNAIWSNALISGGLYLMTGDYCPICESEKYNNHPAEWWIKNAADEQFEKAKELGLVAKPS